MLVVARKKFVGGKQERFQKQRRDIEVVSAKAGRSGHEDRASSLGCLMTHTAAAEEDDGGCAEAELRRVCSQSGGES